VWADSHCHIGYDGVEPSVIDEARAAGVGRIITIGTDASTSADAVSIARAHPGVWATVGLHPHDASDGVEGLRPLLQQPGPEVVAVGECGLDFFYEHSPRAAQRKAFAAQIGMASELGLALVVHTRDAWDETFQIISAEGPPDRWILHCFSGGPAEAKRGLDLGAFLSFSGIVTFKKADDVRQAAAICPLDRLLVETDSPFLAPVPNRGKPNRPGWVPLVGAAVADIRGVPVGEVERVTWANTARVFRLPDEAAPPGE
jgi:TatD DNase family protein